MGFFLPFELSLALVFGGLELMFIKVELKFDSA